MAEREYIVTASGQKKATGEPYSVCAAVIRTKNGSFLSDREKVFLEEIKPAGTKIKVDQKIL